MITYQGPGINPNSQIANNAFRDTPQVNPFGYAQQPMMNVPPIGHNMMPIGGQGYNQNPAGNAGGYYNPSAGYGYYNPYLVAEQMKAAEAVQREKSRQVAGIWKKLSRIANGATGAVPEDLMEGHLKRYDPVETQLNDEYYEQQKIERLYQFAAVAVPVEQLPHYRVDRINREIEKVKEQVLPDHMDLSDFLYKCGELHFKMKIEESKSKQKDVSKLYKSNEYNQLLKLHKGANNYFSDAFGTPMNIDDMEIKLPSSMSQEYNDRKKKFLESIFGGANG